MMARRVMRAGAALLFATCAMQPALAQPSAPPWPAVHMLADTQVNAQGQGSARIYVSDAAGLPRTGVQPEDLTIRFGGQPVAGVQVQTVNTVPLQVVLGLDVSLWNTRDAAYTTALSSTVLAVKQAVEDNPDSSFVAFPFSTTLMLPATRDVTWLQNSRLWGGPRTAFYAAVDHAARQLAGSDAKVGRKVIILLTNSGNTLAALAVRGGLDNTPATAINSALQVRAPVVVFFARERVYLPRAERYTELNALVKATGGMTRTVSATDVTNLPAIVKAELDNLSSGYRVTFTSTARVDAPQTLEIGLTPARLTTGSVPKQNPLAASWQMRATSPTPDDTVMLAVNPAWKENILSVWVYVDGVPAFPIDPKTLTFKLSALKEEVRAATSGRLVLSATVEHGLNIVTVPPLTISVPAPAQLRLTGLDDSATSFTLATNQVVTVTAENALGQKQNNVTFVLTDAQGIARPQVSNALELSAATLSQTTYTLQASAEDAWGRRMESKAIVLSVDHGLPLGAYCILALSGAALAAGIVAKFLVSRRGRREVGRAQGVYRLVNYGSLPTAFTVLADYEASDFKLTLRLQNAQAKAEQSNADGKLELTTGEIPPQGFVLLRVSAEPARMVTKNAYPFTLQVRPTTKDAAEPKYLPDTLYPSQRTSTATPSA